MLRGPCSFAIIDFVQRKALCAIDRFGIATMCYAEPAPGVIVFGSSSDGPPLCRVSADGGAVAALTKLAAGSVRITIMNAISSGRP